MNPTNDENIQENPSDALNLIGYCLNNSQSDVNIEIDQKDPKQSLEKSITRENQIFDKILTKIQYLSKKLDEDVLERYFYVDLWFTINDALDLIEKNQITLTDEDLQVVEKEFYHLLEAKVKILDNSDVDVDHTKELFYKYLNLINRDLIRNCCKNGPMTHHLTKISCLITQVMIKFMRKVHYIVCFKLSSDDQNRPTNFLELLSVLLNYLQILFHSRDLNDPDIATKEELTMFFNNYTDATNLVPEFIQLGYAQVIIDLFKLMIKTQDFSGITPTAIIGTIHNISRHDQGIKWLNDLNVIDFIIEFQNLHSNKSTTIFCCMILALLSTPEQIKNHSKIMNDVLDHLLEIVYETSSNKEFEADGFHVSEILVVFVKLFNDDRIVDYILEQSKINLPTSSTLEFFIQFFIDYYSLKDNHDLLKHITLTALVNMFWSISFQEKYKKKFRNSDPKFKEFIECLTKDVNENIPKDQYIPKYLENIQKAATCLLLNLNKLNRRFLDILTSTNKQKKQTKRKPLIMISYSHEDIHICEQLHKNIIDHGYDIWVDFICLQGCEDLWETIAVGMKDADMILCLISESYCKSKSCRQEAIYALEKLKEKKTILPIYLQRPELPAWLDLKQLENQKLSELINIIQNKLPTTETKSHHEFQSSISLPTHYEPESTLSSATKHRISIQNMKISKENQYLNKPIEQWQKSDIYQWFQDNEILSEFRDLCQFKDGYELIIYTRLFLDTEKLQYQLYSDEFSRHDGITKGQKPLLLHEFTKFASALRKLQKLIK